MTNVGAIIPAFNEASTIASVVAVVRSSPLIQEVIVVSDGSMDRTAEMAKAAGATVYELVFNRGKGEAMSFGVSQTDADVVVFLDADLVGLTTEHVKQLVSPVISGELSMNVGLRDRGRIVTGFTTHLPLISGERAMPRAVFESVPQRWIKGFMVEIALNAYCRSRRLRYASVKLTGLTIRRKYQKVGIRRAVLQYARMAFQIVKAMIVVRIARLLGKF